MNNSSQKYLNRLLLSLLKLDAAPYQTQQHALAQCSEDETEKRFFFFFFGSLVLALLLHKQNIIQGDIKLNTDHLKQLLRNHVRYR